SQLCEERPTAVSSEIVWRGRGPLRLVESRTDNHRGGLYSKILVSRSLGPRRAVSRHQSKRRPRVQCLGAWPTPGIAERSTEWDATRGAGLGLGLEDLPRASSPRWTSEAQVR